MTKPRNPFNNVTISVTGMGLSINHEMVRIEEFFKSIGYTVHVINPHDHVETTPAGQIPMTNAEFIAWSDRLDKQRRERDGEDYEPNHVTIVANHLPWGG